MTNDSNTPAAAEHSTTPQEPTIPEQGPSLSDMQSAAEESDKKKEEKVDEENAQKNEVAPEEPKQPNEFLSEQGIKSGPELTDALRADESLDPTAKKLIKPKSTKPTTKKAAKKKQVDKEPEPTIPTYPAPPKPPSY